jgi:hypothetical protein
VGNVSASRLASDDQNRCSGDCEQAGNDDEFSLQIAI